MKKSILMLSAISLLIVVSCKKNAKEEEKNLTCQISGYTDKFSDSWSLPNKTYSYTFDGKGRVIKLKSPEDHETNYSYSDTQIIVESPFNGRSSYKNIYQLDVNGRIVSAVMKTTIDGLDRFSELKYKYNGDGYLSEIQDTDKGQNGLENGATDIDEYSYRNGNLTSIETIISGNYGNTVSLNISHTDELIPTNFFTSYHYEILTTTVLKAYFGKPSKNLISRISNSRSSEATYLYQKNAEGNITQMIETKSLNMITREFTYSCKNNP